MQTKPEICYECVSFRIRTEDGSCLCINPNAYWCDRQGIGKATRACHHGKLNPKLAELYPTRYALPI